MEQLTIQINANHDMEEVLRLAKEALDDLARAHVKILPIDPVDIVHCELLHDEQGREFRYVKQFDIDSGITVGRIDIRYAKEGEPAVS
jgi:hypothetical protein